MTDPKRDPFQEGVDAHYEGKPRNACPYPPDTDYGGYSDFNPAREWFDGWNAADEDNSPEHDQTDLGASDDRPLGPDSPLYRKG